MRSILRSARASALVLLSTTMITAAFIRCAAQTRNASPEEIVAFLTRADRSSSFVFNCGETFLDREDRAVAELLVKAGSQSIPSLEGIFEAIEQRGQAASTNSGLLLAIYARIMGANAYPRLVTLIDNPRAAFLAPALNNAVAIAFGLTSYVSVRPWMKTPRSSGPSCHPPEPRDALDRLLFAWITDDRGSFEKSLGPAARGALEVLLRATPWEAMRAEIRHGKSAQGGLGYRFEASGQWGAPLFAAPTEQPASTSSRDLLNPALDVLFKNTRGTECGRQRVKFSSAMVAVNDPAEYLVDVTELRNLLMVIESCVVE